MMYHSRAPLDGAFSDNGERYGQCMAMKAVKILCKGILLIVCAMWLFGCTPSGEPSSSALLGYRQNPFSCDITVSTGNRKPQKYHMIHTDEDSFSLRNPSYDESYTVTTSNGMEAVLAVGEMKIPLRLHTSGGIGLLRNLLFDFGESEGDLDVEVKEENGTSYYLLRDGAAEFLFDMETCLPKKITYNSEQETTIILMENLSFLP